MFPVPVNIVDVHLSGTPGSLCVRHGAGGVGVVQVDEGEDTLDPVIRQAGVLSRTVFRTQLPVMIFISELPGAGLHLCGAPMGIEALLGAGRVPLAKVEEREDTGTVVHRPTRGLTW